MILLVFHDLTPVHRAEIMRADFIANASHELRTPLAALSGFIDTLLGSARDDADARTRFLAIMKTQATRMARLIDDLLSLSRVELTEHMHPETPVDLVPIVRQVVDGLQTLAQDRSVEIRIAHPAAPVMIAGDRDELTRVFENHRERTQVWCERQARRNRISETRSPDAAAEILTTVRDYGPAMRPSTFRVLPSGSIASTCRKAGPKATADADGKFTSPQSEWAAYTGHSFDVHQGDGWLVAIHPDDRAAVQENWRAAVTEGRLFEAAGRLYCKAFGDYRHFVTRAAPLLDEAGEVREWVGHVIDVHDTHVAEVQAKRTDAQLRSILDHSPAFIWVKDPGGRYVVAGRQCQAVLGLPSEAVVGKTDRDLLPAASAEALRVSERRVLERGETIESEEMVPVEGELRTFMTVKFPLRDERGTIYAVAGISTDITERKRQAEEIRTGVERRDHFLAMLSHELRTPLGAILNAADLVDRGGGQGRPASHAQDVIRRQTRHMAKLVEDLLDVGRITRDQLLLEPRRIDLRAVIEEALEVIGPECERKRLDLRALLPHQELPVRGDNVRLRQVFTNLLSNALVYTAAGHVELEARADVAEGVILVTVKDTGMGMSQDEMERIFELFYQTPQTLDRNRGGLGVGLTLARKLVDLHGGELSAHSAGPQQGSVFTVKLPLSREAAANPRAVEAARPEGRLRIVVVEDNQDIRDTLEDLLRLDGHEVVSAKEGIGGAQRIVEFCPDVAIVDVGLPGMDGYAVAKAVRAARGRKVRLIALTGYGRREDRIEATEAGFDRHLVKPIDHDVLSQALAELLAAPATENN